MTSLPDDVRLSIAAEQARAAADEAADAPAPGGDATAEAAGQKLSPEELAFRARQAAPDRFASQGEEEAPDAKALFEQAMRMRSRDSGQERYAFEADNEAALEAMREAAAQEADLARAADAAPDGQEVWQRVQAMRASHPARPPAEADTISTAAVAASAEDDAGVDALDFTVEPQSGAIGEETTIQLRLRKMGGRVPHRIVIGRVDGEGFEVLSTARARADAISAITGGDAGMSYDPKLPRGAVRIEYQPLSRAGA